MEYIIIEGYKKEDVIRMVNEHLQQGWELHGDLCASAYYAVSGENYYQHCIFFAQAMVKRK
jgi:hypothetical protein